MDMRILLYLRTHSEGKTCIQIAKHFKCSIGEIQITIGEMMRNEEVRFGTYGRYVAVKHA